MSRNKGLRTGQKAAGSGQYRQVGPRGGLGKEVAATRGKPLPPTPRLGMSYRLVDPTRNKSGRGR